MLHKGDGVRVLPRSPVEASLQGAAGIVTGFRPDGLVVVLLPGGARAPFRREELEELRRP
jgi:hypothetical protein